MELRMSRKERDRLKVIEPLADGRLTQVQAAALMRLSVRQVRRVLARYRASGDAGLVHRARGRPSNRRIPAATVRRAVALIQAGYRDFGPTLAAEMLAERDGILVSREWLRQRMIEARLWHPRRRRVCAHLWRPRRASFGELVQMDASEHAWLEGRGEAEPVLLTMIDDAASRRLLRFFPANTTEANLEMLDRWLRRHGRFLALYADRDSIYHVNRPLTDEEALAGSEAETQFGRALRELDIPYIPASSPQAKGRVERSFGLDQDRLVKGLRLAGARTVEAANRYVEEAYGPMVNARFTVPPASTVDAHRPCRGFALKAILSIQETRTVTNDYTLRYHGQVLQIQRRSVRAGLRGGRVIVEERLNGTRKLRFRGQYLRYHAIGAPAPATPRAKRKRRRAAASASAPSASAAARRPAEDHPWRQPFKRSVLSGGKPDISTLR